jgi:uracil DNA glycosylase
MSSFELKNNDKSVLEEPAEFDFEYLSEISEKKVDITIRGQDPYQDSFDQINPEDI